MENLTLGVPKNDTFFSPGGGAMDIFKVIFTLILILIMFGMGCAVDHRELIRNIKRPMGIALGLSCQIILMPTLTYSLIKIFNFSTIHAIAFMLVGCSPGGNNSNVITYLVKGDISLSIAMTAFSNLLTIGSVPFWLFVFTSIEKIDDSLQIPYISLVASLLSILIPSLLGIAFRYKFPKKSKIVTKATVFIAIIMLIVTITTMIVVTKMPFVFTIHTILPVTLLPVLGMVIPFTVASIPLLKLSRGARKAVALEAAIQNGGMANSVLVYTFADRLELLGGAMSIPLMYNISQTVCMAVIVVAYRTWYRCKSHHEKELDLESDSPGRADGAPEKKRLNSREDSETKVDQK